MTAATSYALFDVLPALQRRLPRVTLGHYPTPVECVPPNRFGPATAGNDLWIKREDRSSPVYGGNKIRPIELVFGDALRRGAQTVWATGSLGSNHAVATALHASTAGLKPAALLWPQPNSLTARENLEVTLATASNVRFLRSIAALPAAMTWLGGEARLRRKPVCVQAPGAATPLGALGHLSAGLELASQVRAGEAESPHHLVVGVGSTCTAAGLLVGLQLARHLGLAFRDTPVPHVHGVRVTPWPVTDWRRIVRLALRTARLLSDLGGPELNLSWRSLRAGLSVHAQYLQGGYGKASVQGRCAISRFARHDTLPLDTTYSAKAAAFALDLVGRDDTRGPVLFWATKSSAPLPTVKAHVVERAPLWVRRWLSG